MELNILGSGGVMPMPRPTCFCTICEEAREKGIPYYKTGCSMFINDINLLFDTPEEIRIQLNRERITKVEHLILTHWHPDHTLGIRILEQLNWNFANSKPFGKPIKVYISNYQKETFKKMSCGAFLDFYESKGMIEILEIEHKKEIIINSIKIIPYIIDHTKGFYFLIEDNKSKVIYAPCEYHNLVVFPEIKDITALIVHNLFWENPNISPRKNKPKDEDSFEKMLTHADQMGTSNIYLTHIEETFKLSHDDLYEKMKIFYPNYNIVPLYDGQKLKF